MKTEEFRKRIEKRHNIFIIPYVKGWEYDERMEIIKSLKMISEDIEFPCEFNERGCQVHDTEVCCCQGCHETIGWFDYIPEKDFPLYAKKFSDKNKNGFWRKGKGCVLPRELRSTTCVSFLCGRYRFKDGTYTRLGKKIMSLEKVIKDMERKLYSKMRKIKKGAENA